MLAIEFRDISRIFRSEGDTKEARRFIDRAIDQTRQVIAGNPGTRVAGTAKAMLDRLESEIQTPGDKETNHIN
jgi:hypothetical protein